MDFCDSNDSCDSDCEFCDSGDVCDLAWIFEMLMILVILVEIFV